MTVSIAYKPHTWVENSIIFYPHTINLSYMIVTYLAIGLAVFIIAHSYQMHNGSKYTSIRFQTEFGALSALLASILILICIDTPNQVNSAVMYDFFGNGLLNLTTLLCDSYMFYYRLCAIIKLPKWKRIFFHCYIWAFIVLPWFPTYNIIPIFFDTNDDVYTRAYYISSTCVSAAIIVYNFIVTLEFTKILLSIYLPGVARSAKIAAINNSPTTEMPSSLLKIKVVAIKSIGHCLTSCSGVFCFTLVPVYGPTIQTVILIVGMHFWFNVKKTKNSWLSDVCLFKSSIFPESFFDSNSMDVDQHLGRLAPPLTPGDPAPNNDIQMDKDKDKDKDRGGDSLGNSCKAEPDALHLHAASSVDFKSHIRPACNPDQETTNKCEKEKERASKGGCDVSSKTSSSRKKKKNTVFDSISNLGFLLTGSSRRVNSRIEGSSKGKRSQNEPSLKCKDRDKKFEDFDKDKDRDRDRMKEIGSLRDRDRDRDRDREGMIGAGQGPDLDISSPHDHALTHGTTAKRGDGEWGGGEEEEVDDGENRRQESIGTFPTVNDGVSSVENAALSSIVPGVSTSRCQGATRSLPEVT